MFYYNILFLKEKILTGVSFNCCINEGMTDLPCHWLSMQTERRLVEHHSEGTSATSDLLITITCHHLGHDGNQTAITYPSVNQKKEKSAEQY